MRWAVEQQELLDLGVRGLPQLAVMLGIFDQDFVRAQRRHAVVESLSAALGLALDVIDGGGVDHGAGRPRACLWPGTAARLEICCSRSFDPGHRRHSAAGAGRGLRNVVAGQYPGAGEGIFAQFHMKSDEAERLSHEGRKGPVFHGKHR